MSAAAVSFALNQQASYLTPCTAGLPHRVFTGLLHLLLDCGRDSNVHRVSEALGELSAEADPVGTAVFV